jgi:hypothetical protein
VKDDEPKNEVPCRLARPLRIAAEYCLSEGWIFPRHVRGSRDMEASPLELEEISWWPPEEGWNEGELCQGGAYMKRLNTVSMLLLCAALALGLVSQAMAGAATKATAQPYEGQIKSIKIDKCGLQPGSCEGSIVMARAGGAGEVSLAIKPGSWLKRGDQFVTIDELGVGNYVKVEAVQIPGIQLQQISILSTGGD